MKLIGKISIFLFFLISSLALVESIQLLKKGDPRVVTEHYPIGNGKSIIISNHPPVATAKGMRYAKKESLKRKAETSERVRYPSFNKINKQEDVNYCLGGEDVTDLKTRLQKFSDSTCLPVFLAPG